MRSILITHNIGHSPLEGFENTFAPIVLEDRAQIGMQCTLYAGIRVGKEAIVGSNSYVVNSVPARKLAMGNPARAVHESCTSMTPRQREQVVNRIVHDFAELLGAKGFDVMMLPQKEPWGFSVNHSGKRFLLVFIKNFEPEIGIDEEADETAVLTFQSNSDNVPEWCCVFNLINRQVLASKGIWCETTREYLRKRGMRFEPGPWRYAGGLI